MSENIKVDRRDFMRSSATAAVAGAVWLAAESPADMAPPTPPTVSERYRESGRIALTFDKPTAMAVGSDGSVYAAGDQAVVVFSDDAKETARYRVKGAPECLAVLPDGRLLLGMRDHVEVLDPKSASVTAWPSLGERGYLTSFAVDEENVYAADAGNRAVLRFDHSGKLRGRIGERDPKGEAPGLVVPSPYFDVAIDAQGALWVVNPGRHGLENYRPNGELLSAWYRPGMDLNGFCGCCNPTHIAFRGGTLVTAEKGLNRVKVYGPDTRLSGVVATPELLEAAETTSLNCAHEPPIIGLAVDARNRILVLHRRWKAIVLFEETAGSA